MVAASDASAQSVTFGGSASGSTQAPPEAAAGATAAPTAPAAAPAPAVDQPTAQEDEWAERDRKLNESTALYGGVGLLHTQYAQGGAPGQFRLSFTTEYFSAGFLCTTSFPCKDPTTGLPVTSDSLDHIGGTINLSVTVLKWLETYASTGAYANSDDKNRPSLLQVLGDTNFGLKAFGGLNKWFFLGGGLELWLVNGTGSVGLAGGGTGAKFRGLSTLDLRGLEKPLPLRFGLSLTYSVDNTGAVVEATERDRGNAKGLPTPEPITRIERFGLKINRVDHFDIGIGAEFFAAQEKVRPFIEYSLEAPINRQNYLCKPNNPSGDKCLANEQVAPSKFTFGGRFFPWKQGFGLLAALDVGVTGVGTFIEEVAPVAPWTLYLGAGWGYDTWDRPPVEKIKMVEKVIQVGKQGAVVHGFVHEQGKQEGIANARVAYQNHPEWNAILTNGEGRFNTMELAEGPYTFDVSAEGYKPTQCNTQIAKDQKEVQLDCPMEALPRVGTVSGHVKDADTGAVIANANVKLVDAQNKELSGGVDSQGGFHFEQVSPGTAQVTVDADGYLTSVQPLDVKVRTDNAADVALKKRPKNPLVTVGKQEITIKQQIQFALDSATILPESSQLLTEIADALIKNPRIKKVEIQGHTDNSGTADHNRVLSEDRANAVRNWLTSHGVAGDRLVAKGYGQDKPLVPNVTAANKARNRRVQFIILEQDAAPAEPKKGGGIEKSNPFNLPPP
jgi:outer membrane protein OmpA-like peptidoglycan-associated protein